jgi:hypothetical protein
MFSVFSSEFQFLSHQGSLKIAETVTFDRVFVPEFFEFFQHVFLRGFDSKVFRG